MRSPIENIRIIREEKLVENVHDVTGPYLAKRLEEFRDHPLVGEVRSMGFVGAIELVKDKKTHKTFEPLGQTGTICRDHCVEERSRHAGDPRHHADVAAADLDQGACRRVHEARDKSHSDATAKDVGL